MLDPYTLNAFLYFKGENCMNEIWKDIKGYEGLYQVSNKGRVKSVDRVVRSKHNSNQKRKGRILKQHITKDGYLQVTLSKCNKLKTYRVHQLVGMAFLENTHNYIEINHKDENPLNNDVRNIEWCSRSYNNNYGNRNNKCSRAVKGIKRPQYVIDKISEVCRSKSMKGKHWRLENGKRVWY